jgi:ABC-2 type transport system ATP-binding protein
MFECQGLAMAGAIEIHDLTKRFGEIIAVDGVSLDVRQGEVFGFLGPNAAGKSTTVKIAATLLTPNQGTVIVDGHDVLEEGPEVRASIGLLPEDGADTHYDRLTAAQNLEYYGRLYGVPREELDTRIDELLEFLELTERRDQSPGLFSTGLKQKLSLARALVHDPPVVFLDEPTSSLDPIMSKKVRDSIDKMSEAQSKTFFMCTHLLSEAETVCDRVAFISHGRLVELGRPKDLRRKFWVERTFEVQLVGKDAAKGQAVVQSTGLAKAVRFENNQVVFVTEDAERANPRIVKALVEAGLGVLELRERVPSLEDVYVKVIGGR